MVLSEEAPSEPSLKPLDTMSLCWLDLFVLVLYLEKDIKSQIYLGMGW